MNFAMLKLASAALALSVLLSGCAGAQSDRAETAESLDYARSNSSGGRSEVVAAAIDVFSRDARLVENFEGDAVVGTDIDADDVQQRLAADVRIVETPPPKGPYLDVLTVVDREEYWQVDMAAVNGAEYFSTSLFFVIGEGGEAELRDSADFGVTTTTAVS